MSESPINATRDITVNMEDNPSSSLPVLDRMNQEDFGIDINVTLTLDPYMDVDAASFVFEVPGQDDREMTFYAGVATYTTQEGDFTPGYYYVRVRAFDAYASVATEPFMMIITE